MSAAYMAVEIINSGKRIDMHCVDSWAYLPTQREIKAEKFVDSAKVKLDGLTDREIKIETIKAKMPDFDAKDRSDSYIDGLFEGIVSLAPAVRTDALASTVAAVKNDGAASTAADARKRSMEADRNAYKAKK
jgi:hypothetical protein